jgi:anti-sigma B factor antagonist
MLTFQKEHRGSVTILTLKGNLDAITVPELKPEIDSIVAEKRTACVVDLAGLTLIDSSGVGAIVSLFKRVRALGGDVKVSGVTAQPKEIFRLLRLDRALDIHPSTEEAIAKFSK